MSSNREIRSEPYRAAMKLLYGELGLQFQRLNFFLVGTAFLITAYAVVTASDKFCPNGANGYLIVLAHAVNAIGFCLALGFAMINYANAKVISGLYSNALKIEANKSGESGVVLPLAKFDEIDSGLSKVGFLRLLAEMPKALKDFVAGPLKFSKESFVPVTWILPLFFALFWLVIWFWILRPHWYIPTTFLSCVGVLFIAGKVKTRRRYSAMATAYCMKCRRKVEIKDPKQVTLKNNRPAVQGVCPSCGTRVFRIGKA